MKVDALCQVKWRQAQSFCDAQLHSVIYLYMDTEHEKYKYSIFSKKFLETCAIKVILKQNTLRNLKK